MFEWNKIRLTKVFIDLSKIVHGMGVGQLKPDKERVNERMGVWGSQSIEEKYKN